MNGDLYTKVQDASKSNSQGNKVKMGYTVNTYGGVLEQLQKAIAIMNGQNPASNSDGGSTRMEDLNIFVTNIGSINIGGSISDDGFVVEGTNYEKYRQQQLLLGSFMPFVVDLDDENGSRVPHYVPYSSPCTNLNEGVDVSGKQAYPIPTISPSYCDSMATGLGDSDNNIAVGVAVDLTDKGTVDTFFEKCYSKIYKEGCAGRLAAKNALFAEIAFVNTNSASAATLHARVIADAKTQHPGKIHNIYLPVPLLLTSEYRTLAKVEFSNGQNQTVGVGQCTYPLADAKYNHIEASLKGFTPKYIRNIVTKKDRVLACGDQATVTFNSVTGSGVGRAYVRFYIKDGVDLQGVFSTETIPDEYKSEIYKGIGTANVETIKIGIVEATNAAVGIADGKDSPYYMPNQVDWEKIKKRGAKYERNVASFQNDWESATRAFNINTKLVLSVHCWETGWAGASSASSPGDEYAWMTCNNPSGLLCNDKNEPYDVYRGRSQFGGIQAAKDKQGTNHGRFWKFRSKEDGIKAFCHILVNSPNYGLKLRQYKNIEHFCLGLQLGTKYPNYREQNPVAEDTWKISGQMAYCPTPEYGKRIYEMYLNSL